MKQKKVWIISGIPGSGKSTWIRNRIAEKGGVHCSRDEIRFSLLKDGEDYFAHEDEVVRLWLEKAQEAINNPEVENIYIDATNLNDKSRKKVTEALPKGDYIITYVIFKVPLDVCIERNSLRTGRAYVPESVIKNMYNSFTIPNSDKIIYINEKGEIIDG